METLEPLIGEWSVETSLGPARARARFAWALDRRFVVQRMEVDLPEAPDALCVIAPSADGGFTQHYFDSRGVVRLYAMTFAGGEWTLERTAADFSPLPFAQRFEGALRGERIEGAWYQRPAGSGTWERDFDITYTRSS